MTPPAPNQERANQENPTPRHLRARGGDHGVLGRQLPDLPAPPGRGTRAGFSFSGAAAASVSRAVPQADSLPSPLHRRRRRRHRPPDSHRAQLCPAAVPSLLHRYSGKSYGPTTLPWKPTNRLVMWGLKQVATTATNLPDKSRMQLSPPLMLSLIHHYSSKGG
ncbi:hypothetical protein PAHAL_3G397400 [Panicum hallii]|uniref:Uncharacterized protein n=1 Tax=Panicum hallii TaxID=206008 RepID=A0A2S3HD43_9POAL|nr:hypothetical protein PAHAL_3G397400 [Panicum hallii]